MLWIGEKFAVCRQLVACIILEYTTTLVAAVLYGEEAIAPDLSSIVVPTLLAAQQKRRERVTNVLRGTVDGVDCKFEGVDSKNISSKAFYEY